MQTKVRSRAEEALARPGPTASAFACSGGAHLVLGVAAEDVECRDVEAELFRL